MIVKYCPNTNKPCVLDACLVFRLVVTLKPEGFDYLTERCESKIPDRYKDFNRPYCTLFRGFLDKEYNPNTVILRRIR